MPTNTVEKMTMPGKWAAYLDEISPGSSQEHPDIILIV